MVSLLKATSVPTNHRARQNMIGDQMPHVLLSFTLPISGRIQPYGMPIAMMASMHPSASTYVDNAIIIVSPINPYLESGSSVHNNGRMTQQLGGLRYIPPGMPPITNTSLLSVRQQMDESNHKMVNILTRQISTMFNPLIQNTNHSY